MKGCRPLSADEVRLISRSFGGTYGTRDRALFLLGVKSGFRISELLSLTVGDIARQGRVVDRVGVRRRHMKDRTEGRSVVLNAEAKHAVQCWLDERAAVTPLEPSAPLFQSRKGRHRPISRQHAYAILRAAYESNELSGPLGTHAMRKTFANHVYHQLHHDLVKTQRALGHRNINSTVSYLSFADAEIDAAILAS